MTDEPRFRTDLYRGTAEHYERFRPPYPAALLDDLRRRVPLRVASRVLDLGCGTGQIAFPLAATVAEVRAVDQEPETVALARRKAQRLGVANIAWTVGAAEAAPVDGVFDLVAIGNAFQRFDRDAVATRLVPHLREGGCVALLWSGVPTEGDRPWQRAMRETFERWIDALGTRDRIPQGWAEAMEQVPHGQVLQRAGLSYEGTFDLSTSHRWTVESLIGFVHSTSLLNPTVLGERAAAFEADLRSVLLACRPAGVFEQDLSFAYELARRAG